MWYDKNNQRCRTASRKRRRSYNEETRIYAVLLKKESSKINVTIPAKKIGNYFPETQRICLLSAQMAEDIILFLPI